MFNLLLQVLDDGRLTDSFGRCIDFRNTIIIMTSNIGTRQLKDFGRGVGFSTPSTNGEVDKDFSRSVIQKALNKAFAPEFINRIDDIVMFDQLDKEAIRKIIDIELQGLYKRVTDLGYTLELTDAAKDFVATKGYDVQFGARPLRRAIQNTSKMKWQNLSSALLLAKAVRLLSILMQTSNALFLQRKTKRSKSI